MVHGGGRLRKQGGDRQALRAWTPPPGGPQSTGGHILCQVTAGGGAFTPFTQFTDGKAEAQQLTDSVQVLEPGRWQSQVTELTPALCVPPGCPPYLPGHYLPQEPELVPSLHCV